MVTTYSDILVNAFFIAVEYHIAFSLPRLCFNSVTGSVYICHVFLSVQGNFL